MRARSFRRAAPLLHAAAWTAAHAGGPEERLAAQIRLADAQLHAREYHSALANYRFAERLAAAIDPDGGEYWVVRASVAQALRRVRRPDQAREQCLAVCARLAKGTIPGGPGRGRMIARMTGSLLAQLDAAAGRFAAAATAAATLAADFLADGDRPRAAAQNFNVGLWSLFAAERAGGEWPLWHDRAVAAAQQAGDPTAGEPQSGEDEMRIELEVLRIFTNAMRIKLERGAADDPAALSVLEEAAADLQGLARAPAATSPSLRLQVTLLEIRIAERQRQPGVVAGARAAILELVRGFYPTALLWAREDLAPRFRWEGQAIPLDEPDPALEALLAEAGR